MSRFSEERGAATVEFALVAPLLLIIMLGVVEFGRGLERVHAMIGISRESANLAARGTPLQQAVESALASATDIHLAENGGVIATQVIAHGSNVDVLSQYASAGYAGQSRIGAPGERAQNLESRALQNGQVAYVVEVFYHYTPVTPLRSLAGVMFPENLYERAVF